MFGWFSVEIVFIVVDDDYDLFFSVCVRVYSGVDL